MRLYIIRHGDPNYELDSLTPNGRLQAEALAEKLKEEGITKIFSSPLGRAKETMSYTADLLGIEPTILDWTQELSGMDVENEKFGEFKAWNIPGELVFNDGVPTTENWQNNPYFKGLGIEETYAQLGKSSDEFLASLGYKREKGVYKMTNKNVDKVAVFCHGAFTRTWLAHLLNIPLSVLWAGFWLSPTSVTTILFEERSEEIAVPRCLTFADVSHLYKKGLSTSYIGISANIE